MPNTKKSKVLVSCIADWNYSQVKRLAMKDCEVLSCSASSGNIVPKALLKLASFINSRLEGSKPFYISIGNAIALKLFDLYSACLVAWHRPQIVFCWGNMSRLTMQVADVLNVKTVLYLGNASLVHDRNLGLLSVPVSFLDRQKSELKLAKKIIVESTYVKNTYSSKYHDKIYVLPTAIPDFSYTMFLRKEMGIAKRLTVPHKYAVKLEIAIIQSNVRKNTQFAYRVIKTLSDCYSILVHVLGESHFLPEGSSYRYVNHGYLEKKEYFEVLSDCDLALFPTKSDGGPRALLECLAFGLEVFASRYCIAADLDFDSVHVLELEEKYWVEVIHGVLRNSAYKKKIPNFTSLEKKTNAVFKRILNE